MESKTTRIRLNLINKEIEIEGSEEFIGKYQMVIDQFINVIKDDPIQTVESSAAPRKTDDIKYEGKTKKIGGIDIPGSFGEFYIKFSREITVGEKMLIAGFYYQAFSEDGLFTPKEASDLLREQSVPVSNASVFVKSLHKANKLFIQSGKYKVSERGIEYIKQLLSQS